MYSPFTERYEIVRATYDKKENLCYTDIGLFRKFINTYGSPLKTLDFYPYVPGAFDYHKLRSESILMCYGYNVSETNNLSDKERHELLAEIVDLEILTVSQVISRLKFFCRLHRNESYQLARLKWESDINYIENYKVKPERFFTAQIEYSPSLYRRL